MKSAAFAVLSASLTACYSNGPPKAPTPAAAPTPAVAPTPGAAALQLASCNMPGVYTCREVHEKADDPDLARDSKQLKAFCDGMKQVTKSAVFAEAACPTGGVIASCAERGAADFYYRGFRRGALDDMHAECSGTFTRTNP